MKKMIGMCLFLLAIIQPITVFAAMNGQSTDEGEKKIPQSLTNEFGTFNLPNNRSDLKPETTRGNQFFSLQGIPAGQGNLPDESFVDLSSNNGSLSVANFNEMKNYGVKGVIVKLTEGTTYTNPLAASQIKNAQTAGLKVSAYHYSWVENPSEAPAEAAYFVQTARNLHLATDTVMVEDIEQGLNSQATASAQAFAQKVQALGYGNVKYYGSLYCFSSGILNSAVLGNKNIWVAAYPMTPKNNLYTQYNAWQWASDLTFPNISGFFDISADYTGTFVPVNGQGAMYRLYNSNNGEHFYTQDSHERDNLTRLGWQYEGVGWNAPLAGDPVYRLYNPVAGDHLYTLKVSERDNLKAHGWLYEGIGWYSDSSKAVPLYRAYNPNATTGTHNYTVNWGEEAHLISRGWKDEGIGWYGK